MTLVGNRDLLSLEGVGRTELEAILELTDRVSKPAANRAIRGLLQHVTVLCSFPESSLRTRVTFEIGLLRLGAAVVNVPRILEKDEAFEDMAGYLANWVHAAVIRHGDYSALQRFAQYASFPIVNAMTDDNHPCEVLADIHALRKLRGDLASLKIVFVGAGTNVCRSWASAASIFGLAFTQVCPPGLEAPELLSEPAGSQSGARLTYTPDMAAALEQADIVLTDGWSSKHRSLLRPYSIMPSHLARCAPDCLLWPCPPVHWGDEISEDLRGSRWFAGYAAKGELLNVQQAILLWTQGISV